MKTNSHRPKTWFFAILPGILALFVDQIVKFQASQVMFNDRLAWSVSWFVGPPIRVLLLGVLIACLLLMACWQLRRHWHWGKASLYSILIGAALSNVLDRLWLGGVRDVWHVPGAQFFGLTMMNNLADWLMILSIIGLFLFDIWEVISSVLLKEQDKHLGDDSAVS